MNDLVEIYRKNEFVFGEVRFTIEDKIPDFQAPWGIVTAWNPDNKVLPLEENIQRNRDLDAMLRGALYTLTHGVGGNDNHFEDSFLIENISFDETMRYGNVFGQYAIYWCDGTHSGYYLCADGSKIL